MRRNGVAAAIIRAHREGATVMGICGGYQMLGQSLSDPEGVEDGGSMKGLGLLPVTTTFTTEKTRTRVNGTLLHVEGNLKALENLKFEGYEIHMGKTELLEGCPMNQIHDTVKKGQTDSGYGAGKQNREQYRRNLAWKCIRNIHPRHF